MISQMKTGARLREIRMAMCQGGGMAGHGYWWKGGSEKIKRQMIRNRFRTMRNRENPFSVGAGQMRVVRISFKNRRPSILRAAEIPHPIGLGRFQYHDQLANHPL